MYSFNEFIERAKKVHGDKYNYSKVNIVDNNEKVCIICPKHGEFWQTPKSHIVRKYGCPKCGREICANKTKKTNNEIINDFFSVHGKKYDYSKVEYTNAYTKVCIICPKHGEFWQTPHDHLKGVGCPKCGMEKQKEILSDTYPIFLEKAKKVHGNKYDYSKADYINQNTKICIICPKHGKFWQTPNNHLRGEGCRICGIESTKYYRSLKQDDFIKRSNKKFNNFYDYSKTDLNHRDENGKIIITCPLHGDFLTNPSWHLSGVGCPKCGKSEKYTTEEFIEKAINKHKNKYTYEKVEYVNCQTKVPITCPKHGIFYQAPSEHLYGKGCPKCGNQISKAENDIYNFCCEQIGKDNVQQRNRIIIHPYELDIYLRSLGYAIEYNGLRWHSEKFGKDRYYHLNKLNACKEKGIKLIQIFEDEYVNKRDIVYNKLKHIMKFDQKLPRIPGRKCKVMEISINEAKDFLEKYHIQGYVGSKVYLGAFYHEELVAVMTFKTLDRNTLKWELTRFASNYNYICQGIGGKLFNYFIKNYNPEEIKSFADRRWTINEENNIYTKLGFEFDSYTKPDYHYFRDEDGPIRQHKFAFRKNRLNKKYGLPLSMTEEEMTENLGYTKIYDCGLIKYVWYKKREV